MKLFKYLLLFFIFKSVLVASTESTALFTTGVNDRTDCRVECPPVKTEFFTRVANFTYETGDTLCYVYNHQDPTKMIGKVVNHNPICAKELLINPNATARIISNTGTVISHLNSSDASVVGNGSGKLNLSKYVVAGLMADDNIIDIPASISTGEVSLKSGYSFITSSTIDKKDEDLVSKAQLSLNNSVTFMMNFFAKSSNILMSLQVALFFFVVAISIIFLFSQKGTKKISQINDHEDMTEKVLLGVFSILMFFLPMNKISTSVGDIPQNGYQQLIRPLLYLGIDTADKLSQTATSSVLSYKFGDIGVKLTQDLSHLSDKLHVATKKQEYFTNMLEVCNGVYKKEELTPYVKLIGATGTFPPSEDIYVKGYGAEEKRAITFYTEKMMQSRFIHRSDTPSVSYCGQVEIDLQKANYDVADVTAKMQNYRNEVSTNMERKINTLTDLTYANVNELGFISIINLGTTLMAFDQFSLFGQDENKKKNTEIVLEDYRKQTGYEVQSFAKQDDSGTIESMINKGINEAIIHAPYFTFLPFANNIKEHIENSLKPARHLANTTTSVTSGFLSGIPFIGKGISSAVDAVGATANLAIDGVVYAITGFLLVTIVSILPLMGIIGAGILVIGFYFLSVIILYVSLPFVSVFAFSTGNLDIIKNLIKNTFLLSVKPVLIVVSVLMAVLVYELFENLNSLIIHSMFEPFFAITNNVEINSASSIIEKFGAGAIILFIKGCFSLLISLITVFICFYFVFNGANIILDMFGMRDGGFGVGAIIGDKVEGKSSVAKTTTLV